MAAYYFDTNGATAGFGTLTGAWNTSTALWSTSSAGTSATSAVTFTNADSANFGFAGTSATAGTATIADGVTVTLNQIVTANLADLQTITRTTSGAITLAGTTPLINVGSAGGLTIAAPIGGSTAWSKTGTGLLTTSGAITTSAGITLSAGSWTASGNISNATGTLTIAANTTFTSTGSISKAITVANTGTANINGNTTGSSGADFSLTGTGVTFGAGTTAFTADTTLTIGATTNTNSIVTLGSGRSFNLGTAVLAGTLYVGNASGSHSTFQLLTGSTFTYNNTSGSSQVFFPLTGAYGCVLCDGGTISSTLNTTATGFLFSPVSGSAGAAGVFEVQAGSISSTGLVGTSTAAASRRGPFSINLRAGTNSFGTFRIGGSQVTTGDTYPQLLNIESGATLTVSSQASSAADSTSANIAATINGAGSKLTLTGGFASTGTSLKNFNLVSGGTLSTGGTIQATSGGAVTAYLYGNGNKIGATTANGVLNAAIKPAPGSGITVTHTADGTNYIGPPVVTVTRGAGDTTGFGAVVRPTFDRATGKITGLVVVCSGYSYTANPTLTFTGGGVSAVAPSYTTGTASNSTDGTIEKVDTGTLKLAADNTNAGTYTITEGTLSIGNGAAAGTLGDSDNSAAVIASGATLNFNRSDNRTYASSLSGAGGISKTTAGSTATISGNNSGLTGSVTITTGVIRATHANALGTGVGAVTVSSGTALELSGGITLARGATIAGTGVGSAGAIRNISGDNSVDTVTLSAAAAILSDSGTLSLRSSSAMTGSGLGLTIGGVGNVDVTQPINTTTGTLTKNGSGYGILRGTSSYTGITTVSTGFLGFVGSIVASTNGNFGNASATGHLLIAAGAGVRYYGTGAATFSRAYTFQGGNGTTNYIESDGTGAVTVSTAPTYATTAVAKTLGIGGSGTAANTISYVIANNGAGAVSLAKAGTGKWVLSNNNTATGAYTVTGGTLVLQGTNTPASVALTTSGTLVLETETGASRTGSATVTANTGTTIQTLKGTNQNGRHTYANLTLNGGRIRIGG